MRGRKPKPTNLKLLHGNPGKRQPNPNEPKPTQEVPRCPSVLDPIARKEWRRFAKVLDRLGLLTEVDGSAFAAYCDQYSLLVQINRDLRMQQDDLQRRRASLQEWADVGDPVSIDELSRLPASALVVHDYTTDLLGKEHLKISANPLITMKRHTLTLIKAFCVEFGMTPSSRGRITATPKKDDSDEEEFLRGAK